MTLISSIYKQASYEEAVAYLMYYFGLNPEDVDLPKNATIYDVDALAVKYDLTPIDRS